jgi:RimJ/RimL family protein N-acetyltransferase
MNDSALMTLHIEALFQFDREGRMLAVNEPNPPPAPRLYFGGAITGNTWRFRHDLPDEIVRALNPLLRAEPTASDLTQLPRCLPALQTVLARHAPVTEISTGPAWHFGDHVAGPAHDVVEVTPRNDAILREAFLILARDLPHRLPCAAILQEGRLASLCFSARNTPHAAEAGLETLEPYRGQGYAPSVVAAWARAVRAQGRTPLYSTSWDNLASRAVARKLRLVLYGADLSIA